MSLKLKFRSLFPAQVTAISPLQLVKTGLSYVFSLNVSPFINNLLDDTSASEARNTLGFPGSTIGGPIVILCTGQSNFVQRPSLSWTPATNLQAWNYNDTDGNVGTAFTTVPSTNINLPEKIASDIALANPLRTVYVIGIAIGSQTIAQWMAGASAPDMYANLTANIVPALAACGATRIDALYWWQGENQTSAPENYVANFNTVMDRFKAETWFPRATPVIVFGLAPSAISGTIQTDAINASLQAAVRSEPDVRRMVYTGTLNASYWADTLHPNAAGFFAVGELGASAYLHGETHLPMLSPIDGFQNNGSTGRPAFRNLIRGGDLTVNPWRLGTSFSSIANGTTFLDNFTYVSSGTGVVDILKTVDAPTVAQAGIYTQHCLHVDVTTADASIGGTDYYGVQGTISGLDSSFLGFGQTGARTVTVSFWVKATITGNYFVAIENSAQTRAYCSQYTVNVSDTWEYKRLVFSGDAAGTWLYTTGVGLRVFWTIASSDTYLFTPEVWNAADVRVGNATRANGLSSTANNFKLALMQVEDGAYPSAFDRVPYASVANLTDITALVSTFLQTASGANLLAALTTKTGTGLPVFGTAPTITNIVGTATNDSASAGAIGEIISSSIAQGSAVSLTTVTPVNITSISLTAGDWDVYLFAHFNGGATTTVNYLEASISLTTGTLLETAGSAGLWTASFVSAAPFNFGHSAAVNVTVPVGPVRISIAGTTTVYFVAQAAFATSTCQAFGVLRARRVR